MVRIDRYHCRKDEYAQSYFETLMEGKNGFSVEDALRDAIDVMGVTEFSKLARVPKPRISEFLADVYNAKPSTLDKFLKPFGLKTKIVLEKVA